MSDTSDKDLEGIVCKLCHNPPQWMPIETCPREEGMRVLLMDNEEEVENSCWDGEQWILRMLSPENVVAWLPGTAIGIRGIKHKLSSYSDEGTQSAPPKGASETGTKYWRKFGVVFGMDTKYRSKFGAVFGTDTAD